MIFIANHLDYLDAIHVPHYKCFCVKIILTKSYLFYFTRIIYYYRYLLSVWSRLFNFFLQKLFLIRSNDHLLQKFRLFFISRTFLLSSIQQCLGQINHYHHKHFILFKVTFSNRLLTVLFRCCWLTLILF